MKAPISLKCLLAVILFSVSFSALAQDMIPPPPIKNSTIDMILGKWKSDPHDMMGSKWSDVADHKMMHNGQYMFIDIVGSNDKGNTYTATIVSTVDKDGNLKGWSFDDWGGVTIYSGKTDGNKINVTGTGEWGSETREITISGNTMEHKVSWIMKGPDGKDMSSSAVITYRKQ